MIIGVLLTLLAVVIALGLWFVNCIDLSELQRSEDDANDLI